MTLAGPDVMNVPSRKDLASIRPPADSRSKGRTLPVFRFASRQAP
jgi:hypothetical protein